MTAIDQVRSLRSALAAVRTAATGIHKMWSPGSITALDVALYKDEVKLLEQLETLTKRRFHLARERLTADERKERARNAAGGHQP